MHYYIDVPWCRGEAQKYHGQKALQRKNVMLKRSTEQPLILLHKCMDHVDRRFEDLKKGQEQRFAKLYQRFKEQDRCFKDQDLRQETWLFEIVRRRGFY